MNLKFITKVSVVGAAILAMSAHFPAVYAAERSALLEEVVVTGRKKADSESLQDVPISASIFNAEKIDLINARHS